MVEAKADHLQLDSLVGMVLTLERVGLNPSVGSDSIFYIDFLEY